MRVIGGDPSWSKVAASASSSRWTGRESDRVIVPTKPGNSGGGKDPDFRCAFEDGEGKGRLAMSLETPDKIRSLQRKLYCKAKAEPAFRFYVLYDKICREDILSHAYKLARANAGAPGVDGITFEQIDASGLEAWLAGLRDELVTKTSRHDPVRRVLLPKPRRRQPPLAAYRAGLPQRGATIPTMARTAAECRRTYCVRSRRNRTR